MNSRPVAALIAFSWMGSLGTALAAPFPVCATDTLDHVPAGVHFVVTPRFLARAREQVAKERDEMERSPFAHHDFSIFFTRRVEWANGSAVLLTCTLKNVGLHQLESGHFVLQQATTAVIHPPRLDPDAPPPTPWRKFTYELQGLDSSFRAQLVCESEVSRIDPQHPYAPFERTLLDIGTLQTLLADDFPMQVRTETDPDRCSALQAQIGLREAGDLTPPRLSESPMARSRGAKPVLPGGAPSAADPERPAGSGRAAPGH